MTAKQAGIWGVFSDDLRGSESGCRSVGFAHKNQDILPIAKKQNRPIYFSQATPTLPCPFIIEVV